MPESAAAHTNVQRALHALILDDNISAAGYLRRALYFLEEGSRNGEEGCSSVFKRRNRDSFCSSTNVQQ
jgi:hypothetical protein